VSRELAKAEADVELVRQRARRDQARLDAGQGSAKDLQAMQHELASLVQRQALLEDVELEIMERQESAERRVVAAAAEEQRLKEELAQAARKRDEQLAGIEAEASTERASRADAAAGLPADLLALYEKVREHAGGIGAARLRARRCEGCNMELNPTDIGRFRDAAPEAVLRCEECRRILVRTPDSGL
jgi:predicted  nucleic acid-binding Zn-ribbon protein